MAVEANLNALLDKAWEDKALSDIVAAPVDALQGVSDGDAKLLKEALNIKTVGDLGKNKYFRAAQLLTQLAELGGKVGRRGHPRPRAREAAAMHRPHHRRWHRRAGAPDGRPFSSPPTAGGASRINRDQRDDRLRRRGGRTPSANPQ